MSHLYLKRVPADIECPEAYKAGFSSYVNAGSSHPPQAWEFHSHDWQDGWDAARFQDDQAYVAWAASRGLDPDLD